SRLRSHPKDIRRAAPLRQPFPDDGPKARTDYALIPCGDGQRRRKIRAALDGVIGALGGVHTSDPWPAPLLSPRRHALCAGADRLYARHRRLGATPVSLTNLRIWWPLTRAAKCLAVLRKKYLNQSKGSKDRQKKYLAAFVAVFGALCGSFW